MGYDATAIAFIGVQVDSEKLESALYIPGQRRTCNHDVSGFTGDLKFCPECGEPFFKVAREHVAGFDAESETLHGFKLMARCGNDYEFIVLVSAAANTREVKSMPDALVNLDFAREQMESALGPMGLFDEELFGLHVFLLESV